MNLKINHKLNQLQFNVSFFFSKQAKRKKKNTLKLKTEKKKLCK